MKGDILQKWEGVVTYFDEATKLIEAEIIDLTAGDEMPGELVTLHLDAINPEAEREYVRTGAVFFWNILEETEVHSVSEFEFYKMKWTQEEIDEAQRRAQQLASGLKWITPECPIGLDSSPNFCSAGSCTYCRNHRKILSDESQG